MGPSSKPHLMKPWITRPWIALRLSMRSCQCNHSRHLSICLDICQHLPGDLTRASQHSQHITQHSLSQRQDYPRHLRTIQKSFQELSEARFLRVRGLKTKYFWMIFLIINPSKPLCIQAIDLRAFRHSDLGALRSHSFFSLDFWAPLSIFVCWFLLILLVLAVLDH